MLGCMEEQIVTADKAKSESIKTKQKLEQEFGNLKKAMKAASNSQGAKIVYKIIFEIIFCILLLIRVGFF